MNFKEISINKLRNRINDEIKSRQIRLIDEEGKQTGIITLEEGLKIAKDLNLLNKKS